MVGWLIAMLIELQKDPRPTFICSRYTRWWTCVSGSNDMECSKFRLLYFEMNSWNFITTLINAGRSGSFDIHLQKHEYHLMVKHFIPVWKPHMFSKEILEILNKCCKSMRLLMVWLIFTVSMSLMGFLKSSWTTRSGH